MPYCPGCFPRSPASLLLFQSLLLLSVALPQFYIAAPTPPPVLPSTIGLALQAASSPSGSGALFRQLNNLTHITLVPLHALSKGDQNLFLHPASQEGVTGWALSNHQWLSPGGEAVEGFCHSSPACSCLSEASGFVPAPAGIFPSKY